MAPMLDTSGSTRFKIEEIQNAVLSCLDALDKEDRLMVISFNGRIYLDSELNSNRPPAEPGDRFDRETRRLLEMAGHSNGVSLRNVMSALSLDAGSS